MQTYKLLVLCLSMSSVSVSGQAQGTFRNLDFESAALPSIPPGGLNSVPITDALPFWTGYLGADQITEVLHNDVTLGAPAISILGPFWEDYYPASILEGQYTVALQPAFIETASFDASLVQIGRLPAEAQSIQMRLLGPSEYFYVSFAGEDVPLLPMGGTTNYTVYAGDISGFAGQTGELRFTGFATADRPHTGIFLDAIVFSPEPVPEPTVFGLFALGTLLLGIRWGRESNRK